MSKMMKSDLKTIFFRSLLLVVAPVMVVSIFFLTSGSQENGSESSPSRGPASQSMQTESAQVPTKKSGLRFQPKPNTRYVYEFQRKIKMKGLSNSFPEISYHGELYLDVITVSVDSFEALVSSKISEAVSVTPVYLKLKLSSHGEMISLTSNDADSEGEEEQEQASILKDLLSNFLFPLTQDSVGTYKAEFATLESDTSLIKMKKTKLEYVDSKKLLPTFVSSQHWLTFDLVLSFPRVIQGEEVTKMGSGDLDFSSESDYTIEFKSIEGNSDHSLAKSNSFQKTQTLQLAQSGFRNQNDADGVTPLPSWHALKDELRGIEKLTSSEQLKVFGNLVKLLRSQNKAEVLVDSLAFLLSEGVLSQGSNSALFKTVVGALATAGSPEAQAALISKVYQDTNTAPSGKGSILAAFTTTQAVLTSETQSFLVQTVKSETNPDLANGAAFALGSSLSNTSASSSQQNQIVSTIRDGWNAQSGSGTTAEKLVWLDVMGNSGRAEFLPDLSKAISNQSEPIVRARAVFSLRFIQSDQAQAILNAKLIDSDQLVREAASRALAFRASSE